VLPPARFINLLHVLWFGQQAPKDEEQRAEFNEVQKALTGPFEYVRMPESAGVVEEDWRPEGLPDRPPAWW
jgi:hypothetical protein